MLQVGVHHHMQRCGWHITLQLLSLFFRDATGKFPEYPDVDEGGSLAIFKQRVEGDVRRACKDICAYCVASILYVRRFHLCEFHLPSLSLSVGQRGCK